MTQADLDALPELLRDARITIATQAATIARMREALTSVKPLVDCWGTDEWRDQLDAALSTNEADHG